MGKYVWPNVTDKDWIAVITELEQRAEDTDRKDLWKLTKRLKNTLKVEGFIITYN